jgi:hypothetical protein
LCAKEGGKVVGQRALVVRKAVGAVATALEYQPDIIKSAEDLVEALVVSQGQEAAETAVKPLVDEVEQQLKDLGFLDELTRDQSAIFANAVAVQILRDVATDFSRLPAPITLEPNFDDIEERCDLSSLQQMWTRAAAYSLRHASRTIGAHPDFADVRQETHRAAHAICAEANKGGEASAVGEAFKGSRVAITQKLQEKLSGTRLPECFDDVGRERIYDGMATFLLDDALSVVSPELPDILNDTISKALTSTVVRLGESAVGLHVAKPHVLG